MRTAVAETSIAAFRDHRDCGKLSNQQQIVMKAFHRPGAAPDYSSRELVEVTGLERQSIVARLNELEKLGFIEWGEKRLCKLSTKKIRPAKLPATQGSLSQ